MLESSKSELEEKLEPKRVASLAGETTIVSVVEKGEEKVE